MTIYKVIYLGVWYFSKFLSGGGVELKTLNAKIFLKIQKFRQLFGSAMHIFCSRTRHCRQIIVASSSHCHCCCRRHIVTLLSHRHIFVIVVTSSRRHVVMSSRRHVVVVVVIVTSLSLSSSARRRRHRRHVSSSWLCHHRPAVVELSIKLSSLPHRRCYKLSWYCGIHNAELLSMLPIFSPIVFS